MFVSKKNTTNNYLSVDVMKLSFRSKSLTHPSKNNICRIMFLILIILIPLLTISFSKTSCGHENNLGIPNKSIYSLMIDSSNPRQNLQFNNRNYMDIINSKKISERTIAWMGSNTSIIELPSGTIAVQLPDSRLGIKFSDGTTSLLPMGSTITYNNRTLNHNHKAIIIIPTQTTLLEVPHIIKLSVENFTNTASFTQSIDALNSYKVKIVFNELKKPDMNDNIVAYTVDWGDGNIETYNTNQTTIIHVYRKSGTYTQKFNITDCFGITYTLRQNYTVHYEGHLMHTYLWVKENKEPVAVTTTMGLGTLLAGLIIFTETGKYKFLAILSLIIPLYTRIQKEDVLDQFVRGQIYGYIKTNPGVHYNQIRREIGIKNGTLSYHLNVLEKTEMIKSRREGLRYRAFYPTGMKFPEKERYRLTELQIKIMDTIKENKGITQKEIAKKLGKKPQTINYNIKMLQQAKLIDVIKKGKKTLCYPTKETTNPNP